MKLEQQVCSLELAQKLKKLGVKQESLFQHNLLGKEDMYRITYGNPRTNTFGRKFIDTVSAFTVAELGEILPFDVEKGDHTYYFYTRQTAFGEFIVEYVHSDWGTLKFTRENTEADARAKCLIYLLENGIIKSNDL